MKSVLAAAVAAIAVPVVALAAPPVGFLPVPKGAAVILNTGSTNTSGYRIVVTRSGGAEYVDARGRATGSIEAPLASRFFADLASAMPLSKIHIEPCMKSASFGTALFVWWRGERSPDVSCTGDAKAAALSADAKAIADALHVSATMRGQLIRMLPNEPRKPVPTPSPSSP